VLQLQEMWEEPLRFTAVLHRLNPVSSALAGILLYRELDWIERTGRKLRVQRQRHLYQEIACLESVLDRGMQEPVL
jgi:hypothetical protein